MEGFFPTSLTTPPPYLGGAESDRAEAAMGGGEMATASAPSPASSSTRMDSNQIVNVGGYTNHLKRRRGLLHHLKLRHGLLHHLKLLDGQLHLMFLDRLLRSSGASGSNLGMQGYETRLYSYFTAGLGYQAEANQNE